MGASSSQLHEACSIGAWVDIIKMAEAIDAGKVQEVCIFPLGGVIQ